jgi:energy-coupling factor transporter ATP-binding protein EcfA2
LTAHADTTVGNLSGGQRKRASIAAQLLGDPDVLVLDEPTAGLDPGYKKVVLTTLRALADAGRTIITVTHSLDALKACDRVLFLGAGGSMAFYGPPKQATTYFKMTDAADVFLALDAAPQLWQQKFRAHPMRTRYVENVARRAIDAAPVRVVARVAARVTSQAAMLFKRHAEILRGDRRHLALLVLQAPVVGALLWAVLPANALVADHDGQFGSKAGIVLLFIVLSTTWLGVSNAIREVVRERNIVTWEAGAGLSARAYIASKFAALGSLVVAQATLITFLATARQHVTGHGIVFGSARVEMIAIAALAGVAATALGLALSSSATSPDRATALLPVTLVMQLVLAGEWAANAHMPLLHEARWVVGTRWAMEAMAATLNGSTAQFTTAIVLLAGIAAVSVAGAVVFVGRAMRPARRPLHLVLPRAGMARVAAVASMAAVGLSITAGGAGVLALTQPTTTRVAASHQAAAPVHHTAATTPATQPVVAAPAVTTPPVTAAPAPVVKHVASPRVPAQTDVSIPVVALPQIVTPEPPAASTPDLLPSPPAVTPASTPTTAPANGWFKFFNPFAPKVNK